MSAKEKMMELAIRVLPKASEDSPLGKLGMIPNTLEWFVTKFSMLEDDDIEGLKEWADYLEEKAKEFCGNDDKGMTLKTSYTTYTDCSLETNTYAANGSLYIGIIGKCEDEDFIEPIATLTVCLPYMTIEKNEAFVDTNNCPWAMNFIKKYKLGKATGIERASGFCSYPLVEFDMDKVNEYCRGVI